MDHKKAILIKISITIFIYKVKIFIAWHHNSFLLRLLFLSIKWNYFFNLSFWLLGSLGRNYETEYVSWQFYIIVFSSFSLSPCFFPLIIKSLSSHKFILACFLKKICYNNLKSSVEWSRRYLKIKLKVSLEIYSITEPTIILIKIKKTFYGNQIKLHLW